MLLIDWTAEEQSRYADQAQVFYPNVIMLSQVYSMLCQQFVEDGMISGMDSEVRMEEAIMGGTQRSVQIDPVTHQPVEAIAVKREPLCLKPVAEESAKPQPIKTFETKMRQVGKHYSRGGLET